MVTRSSGKEKLGMSRERALEFLACAATQPELQARLGALKGRTALDDLRGIAREAGFDFSEEDYRTAIVALAEGELDDEAIENVQRDLGIRG
jgi:predicted ribosomally synthesized peptide with nif11-like leader